MKMSKIKKEIDRMTKGKAKKPKCFVEAEFLYCFCGKCQPKEYELPDDFKRILAIHVVEQYRSNKS